MTHLHPDYEPRPLGRWVTALTLTALAVGTILTLIGLAGATILIWQQVIA